MNSHLSLVADKIHMTINSSFTEAFFGDLVFDPYVFAKTYFKECLREAIDKKIVTIQQSLQQTNPSGTNHINVQIYCNQIDKNNRIHNPVCYREIKSGHTNLLTDYSGNVDYKFLGNVNPSNNTPMIGESSILGPHTSSLLNNRNNAVIKFVDSIITKIINNRILNTDTVIQEMKRLKLQYDNLITRGILPVSFHDTEFKIILQQLFDKKVIKTMDEKIKESCLSLVSLTVTDIEIINKKINEFKNLIMSNV
jgi:hypothetical protein